MKVVSNSSILIGLSAIGRLELLRRRFPEGVIVPDAVYGKKLSKPVMDELERSR